MSKLKFTPSEPLTLGVEVEIQLLDEQTLDLTPKSPVVLPRLSDLGERVKAEIFQSMLEINTGICKDAHEVRADLGATIDAVSSVCRDHGVRLASSGTHPFALYHERILYPASRYKDLIDRNQWIARRLMIFGLHVHIGMKSGEHAIQMNNALLHHLPLLLALSASSPFWHGENTELASSRITFFEALPTGGHPCRLSSWGDFEDLHEKLIRSGAIRSTKDIWWDVRPSPSYGTLEIRICDSMPTLEETVAVTALIHSLCTYIDQQIAAGRVFSAPPDWILRENKWRASRWGLDSKIIINEKGDTVDFRRLTRGLLKELNEIAAARGYQKEFELLERLLSQGPSYARQRAIADENGFNLRAITDSIAREFETKAPIWKNSSPS